MKKQQLKMRYRHERYYAKGEWIDTIPWWMVRVIKHVGCNKNRGYYVCKDMSGFKIRIPTSLVKGEGYKPKPIPKPIIKTMPKDDEVTTMSVAKKNKLKAIKLNFKRK